jgi:hypothetical protein
MRTVFSTPLHRNAKRRPPHHSTLQMLALTEINGVKGSRARLLYQAGLRTPADVAKASREQLLEVRGRGGRARGGGLGSAERAAVSCSSEPAARLCCCLCLFCIQGWSQ